MSRIADKGIRFVQTNFQTAADWRDRLAGGFLDQEPHMSILTACRLR